MNEKLITSINAISFEYSNKNPWTIVYGSARSILALNTFLTILLNAPNILFKDFDVLNQNSHLIFINRINIYSLFGPDHYIISRICSLIILFAVIIGWKPRITGIFHWWVCISFVNVIPQSIIDGGDQIAPILTLFLIPICLTDNRTWHWEIKGNENRNPMLVLFIWSIVYIIRLQVCFIYFHAGIDKLKVPEWVDGTCTYYWFTNNIFGVNAYLRESAFYLLSKPLIVVSITWGSLLLEIILGMSFFMKRNSFNWKILFYTAFIFHLGIAFIFGLITFFLVMISALILYLIPFDYKNLVISRKTSEFEC